MFIKDADDIEECQEIIKSNFDMLKIVYIEGLIASTATFPEISSDAFRNLVLSEDLSNEAKKMLPRAIVDNAFIRATRDDEGFGLAGTLCRGEFLETILRVAHAMKPKKHVSDHLEGFLKTYLEPTLEESDILPQRKIIRESKRLNQLLYDNTKSLTYIFNK